MQSTMEKEHKLETGHLIVCRHCGEIAAQILYSGTFYKNEPAPPKAEAVNVAAIDAAIKEAIHVVEDTSAAIKAEKAAKKQPTKPGDKGWLETQILSLMAFNPEMSAKEIIERTGGKQSTVYLIMRKIKERTGQIEPPKAAPKLSVVPDPEPAQVDYIEWLETYGGRWGETQS
jgi:hypothetical protein